jgi:hypothetical protein
MRTRRVLFLSTLCFFAYFAAEAPSATGAPSAQTDSSSSVAWTARELTIKTLYSNADYDCDFLHDDLTRVLVQLGARASDLNIDVSPCYKHVREGDYLTKAVVKFSVLAPADTTAQNAASAALQGRWKSLDIVLDKSPRKQTLTGSRLNHDDGANTGSYAYGGPGGSSYSGPDGSNYRARNLAILLKSQILPLFATKSIQFSRDDTKLSVQVLEPVDDPKAAR